MHITLHLTNACNLCCHYCYVHKQQRKDMSLETAKAALEFAGRDGGSVGVSFFGGEPLLKKELIKDIVTYGREIEPRLGCSFHFKITTNGTLFDEPVAKLCSEQRISAAISLDGTRQAHDTHRLYKDGAGSFGAAAKAAKLLLAYQPYACAMMVVNPDTVHLYADGVQNLSDMGFQYFICSLNFEREAEWTDEHMDELERQFDRLSDMYIRWTLDEKKFYFSPFEVKMRSHIDGERYCEQRCQLGMKQLSVDMSGTLYPCVQFVGETDYAIGNVFSGIDEAKRHALYLRSEQTTDVCADCAIQQRCNHHCGCLNKQATGDLDGVSPVLCAHERLALAAADRTAETLYQKGSSLFLQKQYNDMFPLVSLIEDKSAF